MSISISRPHTRLKLLAGTAAAALLIGWAAGVSAQSSTPPLPPIPQAQSQQQQQSPQQQPQAVQSDNTAAANQPSAPLGPDDVREMQNQLIALGFNPGGADGQLGPATTAAAERYDQSRGGNGQVAIDSNLLARLKADKAPRLSYEQVQELSQAHPQQASAPAASGASQFGGIVQQLAPLIGAAISSSNSGNYGGGYGYGGYPGPGYYGPGPVYGGYRYGY
jgi:hypothetical protein